MDAEGSLQRYVRILSVNYYVKCLRTHAIKTCSQYSASGTGAVPLGEADGAARDKGEGQIEEEE